MRSPRLALTGGLALALLLGAVALAPSPGAAGGKPPKKKPADASASALPDAKYALPKKFRREWPPGEWASAKAYTFNFEKAYGPGAKLVAWSNGEWNPNLDSTHDLTREQAELALELVHRTAGEVSVSKCAFPRHAVVFFDAEDNPLGSVNVCFECGDILVWPDYIDDMDVNWSKYDIAGKKSKKSADEDVEPLIYQVYAEAMPHWQELFTSLGVPLEPPKKQKPE